MYPQTSHLNLFFSFKNRLLFSLEFSFILFLRSSFSYLLLIHHFFYPRTMFYILCSPYVTILQKIQLLPKSLFLIRNKCRAPIYLVFNVYTTCSYRYLCGESMYLQHSYWLIHSLYPFTMVIVFVGLHTKCHSFYSLSYLSSHITHHLVPPFGFSSSSMLSSSFKKVSWTSSLPVTLHITYCIQLFQ